MKKCIRYSIALENYCLFGVAVDICSPTRKICSICLYFSSNRIAKLFSPKSTSFIVSSSRFRRLTVAHSDWLFCGPPIAVPVSLERTRKVSWLSNATHSTVRLRLPECILLNTSVDRRRRRTNRRDRKYVYTCGAPIYIFGSTWIKYQTTIHHIHIEHIANESSVLYSNAFPIICIIFGSALPNQTWHNSSTPTRINVWWIFVFCICISALFNRRPVDRRTLRPSVRAAVRVACFVVASDTVAADTKASIDWRGSSAQVFRGGGLYNIYCNICFIFYSITGQMDRNVPNERFYCPTYIVFWVDQSTRAKI